MQQSFLEEVLSWVLKNEWGLFRKRWKEVGRGKHTTERGNSRYKNLEERENQVIVELQRAQDGRG